MAGVMRPSRRPGRSSTTNRYSGGGIGPASFGNDGPGVAALDRWVEKGVAPERIIATGIRPGEPIDDPAKVTKLTRPLCAYPKIAEYRGTGSADDAANFACRGR